MRLEMKLWKSFLLVPMLTLLGHQQIKYRHIFARTESVWIGLDEGFESWFVNVF